MQTQGKSRFKDWVVAARKKKVDKGNESQKYTNIKMPCIQGLIQNLIGALETYIYIEDNVAILPFVSELSGT